MHLKAAPPHHRLNPAQPPAPRGRKSLWKPMLIMLALFLAVVGTIAYLWFTNLQATLAGFAHFRIPPVAVTSSRVQKLAWQDSMDVVGSFAPVRGVTVSAETSGKIDKIAFESGDKVKEGDLLVHLDTSVEEAQLNSAQSRWDLAKTRLERSRTLHQQNVATQEELDNAEAEVKQASADAGAIQATIMNRKTVRAPFSGQAGIRQVQLGQYLSAGDPIVTLQTLDPIYINFNLPQQRLGQIVLNQKISLTVDGFADHTFEGTVTAINPLVDPNTRNVQIQGTVSNPNGDLRPGMFAQVSVQTGAEKFYLTVPQTAVSRAPYSNYIYVIRQLKDPQGQDYLGVHQQVVQLGPSRGDQVAITEGLQGGDEVVTSGLFKLSPNAAVEVNNTVQPGNNPAPHPVDN